VRRLVRLELVHPVGDDLRTVDEDVGFLRVPERLRVHVAVADDGALAIDREELDVAVAGLEDGVVRADLDAEKQWRGGGEQQWRGDER
jgi:hypothetical protein